MERRLKLIWDFRGPGASKTAEHHEQHLRDYVIAHGLHSSTSTMMDSGTDTRRDLNITGHRDVSDTYSYAFMVVAESEMPAVRDALKPHRGEIHKEAPHDSHKDASSKPSPN